MKRKNRFVGLKSSWVLPQEISLVDNPSTLTRSYSESGLLIATHCEDERIIKQNFEKLKSEKPNSRRKTILLSEVKRRAINHH
jgi:dihydroorotase